MNKKLLLSLGALTLYDAVVRMNSVMTREVGTPIERFLAPYVPALTALPEIDESPIEKYKKFITQSSKESLEKEITNFLEAYEEHGGKDFELPAEISFERFVELSNPPGEIFELQNNHAATAALLNVLCDEKLGTILLSQRECRALVSQSKRRLGSDPTKEVYLNAAKRGYKKNKKNYGDFDRARYLLHRNKLNNKMYSEFIKDYIKDDLTKAMLETLRPARKNARSEIRKYQENESKKLKTSRDAQRKRHKDDIQKAIDKTTEATLVHIGGAAIKNLGNEALKVLLAIFNRDNSMSPSDLKAYKLLVLPIISNIIQTVFLTYQYEPLTSILDMSDRGKKLYVIFESLVLGVIGHLGLSLASVVGEFAGNGIKVADFFAHEIAPNIDGNTFLAGLNDAMNNKNGNDIRGVLLTQNLILPLLTSVLTAISTTASKATKKVLADIKEWKVKLPEENFPTDKIYFKKAFRQFNLDNISEKANVGITYSPEKYTDMKGFLAHDDFKTFEKEFRDKVDALIAYAEKHKKQSNDSSDTPGLSPETIQSIKQNFEIFKDHLFNQETDYFSSQKAIVYNDAKDYFFKVANLILQDKNKKASEEKAIPLQHRLDQLNSLAQKSAVCAGGILVELGDVYDDLICMRHSFKGQLWLAKKQFIRDTVTQFVNENHFKDLDANDPKWGNHVHYVTLYMNQLAHDFGLRFEKDPMANQASLGVDGDKFPEVYKIVEQALQPETVASMVAEKYSISLKDAASKIIKKQCMRDLITQFVDENDFKKLTPNDPRRKRHADYIKVYMNYLAPHFGLSIEPVDESDPFDENIKATLSIGEEDCKKVFANVEKKLPSRVARSGGLIKAVNIDQEISTLKKGLELQYGEVKTNYILIEYEGDPSRVESYVSPNGNENSLPQRFYRVVTDPTLAMVDLYKKLDTENWIGGEREAVIAEKRIEKKSIKMVKEKGEDGKQKLTPEEITVNEIVGIRHWAGQKWIEFQSGNSQKQLEFFSPERLEEITPDEIRNSLKEAGKSEEDIELLMNDITKRAIITSTFSQSLVNFPEAWFKEVSQVKLVEIVPLLGDFSSEQRKEIVAQLVAMKIDNVTRDNAGCSILSISAMRGFDEIFLDHFQANKSFAEKNNAGQNILALALANGQVNILKACLTSILNNGDVLKEDKEIDIEALSAVNNNLDSALMVALTNNNDTAAELFIDQVIKSNLDISRKKDLLLFNKGTPLRAHAVKKNCEKALKKLDDFYLDLKAQDKLSNEELTTILDGVFENHSSYGFALSKNYVGIAKQQETMLKICFEKEWIDEQQFADLILAKSVDNTVGDVQALKKGFAGILKNRYDFIKDAVEISKKKNNGILGRHLHQSVITVADAKMSDGSNAYGKSISSGCIYAPMAFQNFLSYAFKENILTEAKIADIGLLKDENGFSFSITALTENYGSGLESHYKFLENARNEAKNKEGEVKDESIKKTISTLLKLTHNDGASVYGNAVAQGKHHATKAFENFMLYAFENDCITEVELSEVALIKSFNAKPYDITALANNRGKTLSSRYEFLEKAMAVLKRAKENGIETAGDTLKQTIKVLAQLQYENGASAYGNAVALGNSKATKPYEKFLLFAFENECITEEELADILLIKASNGNSYDISALHNNHGDVLESRYALIEQAMAIAEKARENGNETAGEALKQTVSHITQLKYDDLLSKNNASSENAYQNFLIKLFEKKYLTEKEMAEFVINQEKKTTGDFFSSSKDHSAILAQRSQFLKRLFKISKEQGGGHILFNAITTVTKQQISELINHVSMPIDTNSSSLRKASNYFQSGENNLLYSLRYSAYWPLSSEQLKSYKEVGKHLLHAYGERLVSKEHFEKLGGHLDQFKKLLPLESAVSQIKSILREHILRVAINKEKNELSSIDKMFNRLNRLLSLISEDNKKFQALSEENKSVLTEKLQKICHTCEVLSAWSEKTSPEKHFKTMDSLMAEVEIQVQFSSKLDLSGKKVADRDRILKEAYNSQYASDLHMKEIFSVKRVEQLEDTPILPIGIDKKTDELYCREYEADVEKRPQQSRGRIIKIPKSNISTLKKINDEGFYSISATPKIQENIQAKEQERPSLISGLVSTVTRLFEDEMTSTLYSSFSKRIYLKDEDLKENADILFSEYKKRYMPEDDSELKVNKVLVEKNPLKYGESPVVLPIAVDQNNVYYFRVILPDRDIQFQPNAHVIALSKNNIKALELKKDSKFYSLTINPTQELGGSQTKQLKTVNKKSNRRNP